MRACVWSLAIKVVSIVAQLDGRAPVRYALRLSAERCSVGDMLAQLYTLSGVQRVVLTELNSSGALLVCRHARAPINVYRRYMTILRNR